MPRALRPGRARYWMRNRLIFSSPFTQRGPQCVCSSDDGVQTQCASRRGTTDSRLVCAKFLTRLSSASSAMIHLVRGKLFLSVLFASSWQRRCSRAGNNGPGPEQTASTGRPLLCFAPPVLADGHPPKLYASARARGFHATAGFQSTLPRHTLPASA